MIVATTQFSLKECTPEEFWDRVRRLCQEAKAQNADFLLFPEYFSLSFILQHGVGTFREKILNSRDQEKKFIESFQKLSNEFGLCLVAGTIPHLEGKGRKTKIVNRCWIFRPKKKAIFQDKIHMTRFESEEWKVEANKSTITTFKHKGALCAVAICYDVEFPSYCSSIAATKAEIIFVPSCTDDEHGYWRVRHCAEARGIENQSYLVMSSIVEGNVKYPEISEHFGRGVIITPCDIGFPNGGIAAEGYVNQEGIAATDLDLDLLKKIRKNGTVLNLRDSKKNKKIRIQNAK